MKKIFYLTQRYRPTVEATSKEIKTLSGFFKDSFIYNLHLDGYFKIKSSKGIFSHHFLYYPLSLPFLYLKTSNKIIHIYTGLCDRPYLPVFKRKNTIISSTNFFPKEKLFENVRNLNFVKRIIVQSEIQKKELVESGIDARKVSLIYPPVNLKRFSYTKAKGEFTILDASCPGKEKDLVKRGISLLLDVDNSLNDTKIKLFWRGGEFPGSVGIKCRNLQKIMVENVFHADMNQQYAQVHCTIVPYLQFDGYLKLIPTTAIESLAAGKPILVSSQTGIAEIVKKEKCGVVFEPTKDGLLRGIEEIKINYDAYQKNCLKTAEKYFSHEQFIQKYEEIYNSIS